MKRATMGVSLLKRASTLKISIKTPTIMIIRAMNHTKKMIYKPSRSNIILSIARFSHPATFLLASNASSLSLRTI